MTSAPRPRLNPRLAMLAAAVICVALALAYYMFLRVDYAVLSTALKPAEAAAIVANLDARGIPHRLRDDGTTILVPAPLVDDVRLSVASSDLPIKGSVGFELFNKSDMGLTDFAQKINYQRALQGELARTIMMMEGIDTARVHLAIPERSLFRGTGNSAKAAIEVIARPGATLAPDRVTGIQQLVAAAVPDLPVGEVVVLDGEGRVVSNAAAATAIQSPETDERRAAQDYYAARARAALEAQLPGLQPTVRALAMPLPPGTELSDTENARDFLLRVIVLTKSPLNPEEQRIARDAVTTSAALDEARGDSVQFETGTAPTQTVATPTVQPTTPPQAVSEQQPQGRNLGNWIIAAIAGVVVIAIAAVLLRRRNDPLAAGFVDRWRAGIAKPGVADARP